jgi:hypothetical protein
VLKATAQKLHAERTGHIPLSRIFKRSEWKWELPDRSGLTLTQKATRLAETSQRMAATASPDRRPVLMKHSKSFAEFCEEVPGLNRIKLNRQSPFCRAYKFLIPVYRAISE